MPLESRRNRSADHESVRVADPTFWEKWVGGVVFPVLLLAYAGSIFLTRHAYVPSTGRYVWHGTDLYGTRAVALGVVVLSAGLFCHFFCWWGNIRWLATWPLIAQIASAILFIAGLGYLVLLVGAPG